MDPTAPIPFRAAQAHAAYGQRPTVRPNSSPAASASSATSAPTGRVVNGTIVPPLAKAPVPTSGLDRIDTYRSTGGSSPSDAFRLDVTSRREHLSASLSALIAGQVDSPVGRGEGFDAPSRPSGTPSRPSDTPSRPSETPSRRSAGEPLQMYTRAADRIDVATTLRLGGNLDARG
ncbi:MAG: hypothetical protein QM516_05460 [Limnohabitans sp.]|nr:hypothetical protein [Limnohabitans sp.]